MTSLADCCSLEVRGHSFVQQIKLQVLNAYLKIIDELLSQSVCHPWPVYLPVFLSTYQGFPTRMVYLKYVI